ncbi:uncharacterized protein [Dysidea avara]
MQFTRDYNFSHGEKKVKLESDATKALLCLQYKLKQAYLKNDNLSPIWYELSYLCQCVGPIQEASLITLYESVCEGHVSPSHIPCLLYMVGLCCDWLKSAMISDKCMRSGEMLSFKILYVVSLRLHCHYLVGRLTDICTIHEIERYQNDLSEVKNIEQHYKSYPDVILHWNVTVEVGNHIGKLFHDMITTKPSASGHTSSSSTHCLLPVLWHTLDIWVSKDHRGTMLQSAITDLLKCDTEFHPDNWVDAILAIQILSVVAKSHIKVLYLLQLLASGSCRSPPDNPNDPIYQTNSDNTIDISDRKIQTLMATKYSIPRNEGDMFNVLGHQVAFKLTDEGNASGNSSSIPTSSNELPCLQRSDDNRVDSSSNVLLVEKQREERRVMLDSKQYVFETSSANNSKQWSEDVFNKIDMLDDQFQYHDDQQDSYPYHRPDSRGTHYTHYTHYTHSTAPLDGGGAVLGSQAPQSTIFGMHSLASIPSTIKSVMEDPTLGNPPKDLESWPWELVYMFIQCMASLVTQGDSSVIQKFAFDGFKLDTPRYDDTSRSYGLQQLVELDKSYEDSSSDVSHDDFYWLARYSAVMGLSQVCRLCKTQTIKDGFSRAAWDTLVQRHSTEPNEKVLEAYKISNMFVHGGNNNCRVEFFHLPVTSHIATSLAQLFLQSNMSSSNNSSDYVPVTRTTAPPKPSMTSPLPVKAKVDTRRAIKVPIPINYNVRTAAQLNKIAEEHWRRQMEDEGLQDEACNFVSGTN